MRSRLFPLLLLFVLPGAAARADVLDDVGVRKLRAFDARLTGAGVLVAQPEAPGSAGRDFEVNPAAAGQPQSLFSWASEGGHATVFPNAAGLESGHANTVASLFYGKTSGVAPGVAHVASVSMGLWFDAVIRPLRVTPFKVANQSFAFGGENAGTDRAFDDFVSATRTIICSGAGNGGPVLSPATAYNLIAVGAYGGNSSAGPTANGRTKPDIVAPASVTSFSTPLVAGAAAILVQAGQRLGPARLAATDPRTVKALLLNGAAKPAGWTHSATAPLDTRHGAGVLDVFHSYQDFLGGRHGPSASAYVSPSANHPGLAAGGSVVRALRGWNFAALASTPARDGVSHYVFELAGGGPYTLTATLVWNRNFNHAAINNLDLFLYRTDRSGGLALVASSRSAVDNVEHLFTGGLAGGRYDLEVVKHGGASGLSSLLEVYALAWDFRGAGR